MTLASAAARARGLAVAIAWALVALLCAGCDAHPLGTHDVSLAYRDEAHTGSEALAAKVRARLGAAQVATDLTPTPDGVRVIVDRDEAAVVDALITWRGGIALYPLAPGAPMTGPLDALAGSSPPLADLSEGIAFVTSSDGKSLALHLTPAASQTVVDLMRERPGAAVVVARGKTVLRVGPLDGDPIAISFGEDLDAYARAKTTRLLLSTPTLPRLTRDAAEPLPANAPLAVASLVVPFLLSLAWLAFVRRFDRAQPEPWRLVAATFALGGLSVIPAALAEVGWSRLSEWTDPSLVTMGGRVAALPIAIAVYALVVGLSEEGSKLLGAWALAFHRREFDEPVDGLVYGAASALGFAAVENVKYFAVGRFGPVLVVVRTFLAIPAHLFFGALWGYALGQKLVRPRTSVIGFLLLAALAHGAFDALLSTDGMAGLALLLNLSLASLFVILLRRALRYGAVTPAAARVAPARRVAVTIGSPYAFMGCVLALHAVAAAVFVASTKLEESRQRVTLLGIAGMAWLVALLGVVAYGLSRTMPLDVVLDEHGVTFAGATRPWGTLRAVERTARGLLLRSSGGDVWIGPGRDALLAPVARAIAGRIGHGSELG